MDKKEEMESGGFVRLPGDDIVHESHSQQAQGGGMKDDFEDEDAGGKKKEKHKEKKSKDKSSKSKGKKDEMDIGEGGKPSQWGQQGNAAININDTAGAAGDPEKRGGNWQNDAPKRQGDVLREHKQHHPQKDIARGDTKLNEQASMDQTEKY